MQILILHFLYIHTDIIMFAISIHYWNIITFADFFIGCKSFFPPLHHYSGFYGFPPPDPTLAKSSFFLCWRFFVWTFPFISVWFFYKFQHSGLIHSGTVVFLVHMCEPPVGLVFLNYRVKKIKILRKLAQLIKVI